MVWVRSLVPKEKKSDSAAIVSAETAARGSSIMLPIGRSSSTPVSSETSAIPRAMSRTIWSSRAADERDHDLRRGPCLPSSTERQLRISGTWRRDLQTRGGRHAGRASGLLVVALDRCESSRSSAVISSPLASLTARLTEISTGIGQELVQQRINEANRNGQAIIAPKMPMKSSRWYGEEFGRGRRSGSPRRGRGSSFR